jgi:hypothetical protein
MFMRLSARAFAITSGLLWGGCLLLVGLINLAAPSYGADFLRGIGSVYPGFYSSHTFIDVLLGTVYGFVDGAIAGWLFGWLYNYFAGPKQQSEATRLDRAA